jgi:hypothetical protein
MRRRPGSAISCSASVTKGARVGGASQRPRSARIHGTVDAALELVVERKRRPISKGQNLRHEYADSPLRAATERFGAKLDTLHTRQQAEIIPIKSRR